MRPPETLPLTSNCGVGSSLSRATLEAQVGRRPQLDASTSIDSASGSGSDAAQLGGDLQAVDRAAERPVRLRRGRRADDLDRAAHGRRPGSLRLASCSGGCGAGRRFDRQVDVAQRERAGRILERVEHFDACRFRSTIGGSGLSAFWALNSSLPMLNVPSGAARGADQRAAELDALVISGSPGDQLLHAGAAGRETPRRRRPVRAAGRVTSGSTIETPRTSMPSAASRALVHVDLQVRKTLGDLGLDPHAESALRRGRKSAGNRRDLPPAQRRSPGHAPI